MERFYERTEFTRRVSLTLSAIARLRRKMEGLSVAPVVDALGPEGQLLKLLRGQKLQGCHPERAEIGYLFGDAVKGAPLNHAAALFRGKAAHMQAVDDALPRIYLRSAFLLPGELAQKERRALRRFFLEWFSEAVVSAETLAVRVRKALSSRLKLIFRAL